MNSRIIFIAGLGVALVAAIVISATSGDDEPSTDSTTTATTATETTPAEEAPPAEPPEENISEDLSERPVIGAQEGDPPEELEIIDIVEGEGPEAKAGDKVSVQYVGALYDDGTEFDASWNSGQAFTFDLGAGMVIPGWDQGVEGMKVGGRRELIIPSDLAYGDQGSPPTIPGGATLVFVVDLEKIK